MSRVWTLSLCQIHKACVAWTLHRPDNSGPSHSLSKSQSFAQPHENANINNSQQQRAPADKQHPVKARQPQTPTVVSTITTVVVTSPPPPASSSRAAEPRCSAHLRTRNDDRRVWCLRSEFENEYLAYLKDVELQMKNKGAAGYSMDIMQLCVKRDDILRKLGFQDCFRAIKVQGTRGGCRMLVQNAETIQREGVWALT